MAPRLPMLSSLRGSAQSLINRAFSTTQPVAALRDDPFAAIRSSTSSSPNSTTSSSAATPSQNRPRRSSSDGLLSLNTNPRRSERMREDKAGARPNRTNMAHRMLDRNKHRARADSVAMQASHDRLREEKMANDYLREMPRQWADGDVYSPHDLSPWEIRKFKKKTIRAVDPMDLLGIRRPQDMYKNFSMVNEYINPVGQIMHSSRTGLRAVNQRKLAKMIRRAQGMGIFPSIHGHPEIIRDQFFDTKSIGR